MLRHRGGRTRTSVAVAAVAARLAAGCMASVNADAWVGAAVADAQRVHEARGHRTIGVYRCHVTCSRLQTLRDRPVHGVTDVHRVVRRAGARRNRGSCAAWPRRSSLRAVRCVGSARRAGVLAVCAGALVAARGRGGQQQRRRLLHRHRNGVLSNHAGATGGMLLLRLLQQATVAAQRPRWDELQLLHVRAQHHGARGGAVAVVLAAQRRIPVVLHCILTAARDVTRNGAPAVAPLAMRGHKERLLRCRPGLLPQVGVQVV
mmetsp:Transcript_24486/g.72579  ORF Transcript_24486/g.72579 Transcript_24486/m.72579 type:complete len:261 (+) Transcript_24486:376-1158(+)